MDTTGESFCFAGGRQHQRDLSRHSSPPSPFPSFQPASTSSSRPPSAHLVRISRTVPGVMTSTHEQGMRSKGVLIGSWSSEKRIPTRTWPGGYSTKPLGVGSRPLHSPSHPHPLLAGPHYPLANLPSLNHPPPLPAPSLILIAAQQQASRVHLSLGSMDRSASRATLQGVYHLVQPWMLSAMGMCLPHHPAAVQQQPAPKQRSRKDIKQAARSKADLQDRDLAMGCSGRCPNQLLVSVQTTPAQSEVWTARHE